KYANVFGPSAVFSFPAGTAGCSISPDSNVIISFTENSIDSWSIVHQDRKYALRPQSSTKIQISIADVRFCGSQEWVLVRDNEGKGYCYPIETNRHSSDLRGGQSLLWSLGSEAKNAVPIGIGSQGYWPILYYIKGKKDKNLVILPSFASFTLPQSLDNATVNSTIHGETLCVSVSDETSGAIVSYLYSGGDGRIITPNNVLSVLSSRYYVEFRTDYLTKATSQYSTTTYSGPCLIDALTGEHIMHLALLEEDLNDRMNWNEDGFFLYKDKLLSICRKDGKSQFRLFDIGTRSFIKEIIVEGYGFSQGWMSDGYLLFNSLDTLYRVSADVHTGPDILCGSYLYRTGDVNELFFPFQTKDGKRLWYSSVDRAVHPMPINDNGVFTPDGAYFVDLDWHQSRLSIIDTRSIRSFHALIIHGPVARHSAETPESLFIAKTAPM
ncbi:MAG: hypothetical protein IKW89_11450, partial [Bacteroidales bacterium]|nr:hypothetical protein [Bacteroidales bacterium]